MDEREYEIEIKKLDLDTKKVAHERQKFWIAGVFLVLITALINWQIHKTEIGVQQVTEDNKHLSQFVDKILDEDPNTRLYVSEYFETLSRTPEARGRWTEYKALAEEIVAKEAETEAERIRLQLNLNRMLDEISDPRTSLQRREELQVQLLKASIDIEQTQRLLRALNPQRNTRDAPISSVVPGGMVGQEPRQRLNDPTAYPWRGICRIVFGENPAAQFSSTGFLVHPNLILTQFFDAETHSSGMTYTIECPSVTRTFSYSEGVIRFSNDKSEVAIDGSSMSKFQGLVSQVALADEDQVLKVAAFDGPISPSPIIRLSGYPGDAADGSQWQSSGQLTGVTDKYLFHTAESTGGMSGGPLLLGPNASVTVIGMHMGRNPSIAPDSRYGVRFRNRDLQQIKSWISSLSD